MASLRIQERTLYFHVLDNVKHAHLLGWNSIQILHAVFDSVQIVAWFKYINGTMTSFPLIKQAVMIQNIEADRGH